VLRPVRATPLLHTFHYIYYNIVIILNTFLYGYILRRLFRVNEIKPVSNVPVSVRPCVRTYARTHGRPQKVFYFRQIWYVGRGR